MTTHLKSYPSYKPSGVKWLGDVPVHWKVRRIKTLFREKDERSSDGHEELLSLTRSHGLIPQTEASNRIASIEDLSNYKVCRPGTLVMNRMQAWSGMFAVPSQKGLISPDYSVFELVSESEVKYFERLFKTSLLVGQFAQRSRGIGSGFNRLYTADFGSIPTIVPPLSEQTAIVRYLDHTDEFIRRYISSRERLIELLEEYRQAVIHHAVTRGLDPDVCLKPSGVEWLGDVPAHWEVRRLRYLVKGKLTYGANAAAEYTDPDWPRYLRITDFDQDGVLKNNTFRSLPPEVARDYLVQPGDILLARSGATVGKAFLVPADTGEACYAGYLIRVRPHRSLIEPHFLFAFTQSTGFTHWKNSAFILSTIHNISAEKYANLHIPCPPLSEQLQIIRYLDKTTSDIDATIGRARREIELLGEYRTRLIADVVTGKVDVREAAAELSAV